MLGCGMNEYDEMGEQNYSRNRTDSLERTALHTDLTATEYEDGDWVHLFEDRTQRDILVNMKMKLRRFGLREKNLQQMKLLTRIRANRHASLFPETKYIYRT